MIVVEPLLCHRGRGFHAKPVFFCNIFNGELYLDALVIGLFWICLLMVQGLIRYSMKGVRWCVEGEVGVSSAWGTSE